MAAHGYPGTPVRHTPIGDLAAAEAVPGALVFQAGTEVLDGHLVSAGGRVLVVCAARGGPGGGACGRVSRGGGDRLAGRVLSPRHRLARADVR